MGDFTNSGGGACLASQSGKRAKGVDDAVAWFTKYPAIDSYTATWLHAGGGVEVEDGEYQLTGMTAPMNIKRFSEMLKIQGRSTEAFERGHIEKCARLVSRKTRVVDDKGVTHTRNPKSTGYCLPGVSIKTAQSKANTDFKKKVVNPTKNNKSLVSDKIADLRKIITN